ncbi:adenosylhomocysteine nucleosidase [Kribbella steppae]|uniref:Adenosylhomocysteine nucleosidase n=1 Tax=Kribbella steppae TaxID=2512223 RepID=A0A4R2HAX5_9ACTN|nr:adenosylhomocysteine nucleosidase [Kribbella steppae]
MGCTEGIALSVTEYLVVSAVAGEARYVPAGIPVVVTGVGKTAAAVATARALGERDSSELVVLNVGTTGALRDGMAGLYLPSQVINHDINADAVRALGIDPQETLQVDGGDGTVLASGDVFVTDPVVRARLAERAHLVDMEAYGVVYACREYGVPVRVVKHVSDSADESALDWPALVDASAKVLGEWVTAYVS